MLFSEVPDNLLAKYNQSYNQWKSIETLWNNSYQYTSTSNSWVGRASATTIFVTNGTVRIKDWTTCQRTSNSLSSSLLPT